MTEFLVRCFIPNHDQLNDPEVRRRYGFLAGLVGICCNLFLCAGKFLAGFLFGSVAVMADAVNNLSDASSSIVTLLGFKLAAKPADAEHPFGHARMEYLSGLTVAVMILVIGLELAKSSVEKILHPQAVLFSLLTVSILAVSILLKLWMACFNRAIGKKIDSQSLIATAMDSRNDVITTSAVLIASIAEHISGLRLDGYIGLAVALFILYSGIGIVKDTVDPLLGEAPSPELVQELTRYITKADGVLGMHDLMVHDYGPGRRFASAHVEMSAGEDVLKSHDIIDDIEREVFACTGVQLVLHFDPIDDNNEQVNAHRQMMNQLILTIDPRLTLHDFRMVKGPGHTNLIFDVVVPSGFPLTDAQLTERIAQQAKQQDKNHYTVVTVDHSFVGQ